MIPKNGKVKKEHGIDTTQRFCAGGVGIWVAYQDKYEEHRLNYRDGTITGDEYEKKRVSLFNSLKKQLGYSVFEIPKLCKLDWNL